MRMTRHAFHLSLRCDDPYEDLLALAIKQMPRGYAKLAVVNMIREFVAACDGQGEMYRTLMDFARDVRCKRVVQPPDVIHPSPEQPRPEPKHILKTPMAAALWEPNRESPDTTHERQIPLFRVRDADPFDFSQATAHD